MCGRYTLTSHEQIVEDLQASLDVEVTADPWWKPRFNVAPTQPAPVVVTRDGARPDGARPDGARPDGARPDGATTDGPRAIRLMRWGLVPHWVEPGGKKPPLMINARLESLDAKQMFRDALARKRCLVPADGFFEWVSARGGHGRAGKPAPQPYYFHPRCGGDRLFAFAGLWARSRDAHGDEVQSFTIITTRANALVRPIHDRMPIVLAPADHAAWLDPGVDGAAAHALLDHPAGDDWVSEAVSTWVNKADHDDPQCIAPDPAAVADKQGRLFD